MVIFVVNWYGCLVPILFLKASFGIFEAELLTCDAFSSHLKVAMDLAPLSTATVTAAHTCFMQVGYLAHS